MSVLVTGGAGYIGGHMTLGLLDAGEKVVVLDDLSTGFDWAVNEPARLVVGDTGDADLVARLIDEHEIDAIAHFAAKIVVPELAVGPARLLSHQHLERPHPDRNRDQGRRQAVHLLLDRRGLRRDIRRARLRRHGARADLSLRPLETDGRMDARGRRARLRLPLRRPALLQRGRRRPQGRLGQSTPRATHLIKRGVQTALGVYPSMEIFGQDYPTRDGTCVRDYIQVTDLIDAHMAALRYLRGGGESTVCNCGYGHGQTVREVVDVVKRVSGVDFKVIMSPRRPGDPAAIVARADRARRVLGWRPARDNLDDIVRQALDWERRLHNRGPGNRP